MAQRQIDEKARAAVPSVAAYQRTIQFLDGVFKAVGGTSAEDLDLTKSFRELATKRPVRCVIFGGGERVGKSRTIGCVINQLLGRPNEPISDEAEDEDKLDSIEYDCETKNTEDTTNVEALHMVYAEPSFVSGPGKVDIDVEAGQVDWTTTTIGTSCNKVPIIYSLASDAEDLEIRVHHHPLSYVAQQLRIFLSRINNEPGRGMTPDNLSDEDPENEDGLADDGEADPLTQEICAMAGEEPDDDNISLIKERGLRVPRDWEFGTIHRAKLGKLAENSGRRVRAELVRLTAGRYGLYERIEVRIPAKLDLKIIDTAGLAAMASYGFSRTVDVLREFKYSVVVLVQRDGKTKTDVLRAFQKAGVFQKFDAHGYTLPRPFFMTIRNYGKDTPNGFDEGKDKEEAMREFRKLDNNSDYKSSMKRMLQRLNMDGICDEVMQRHYAQGLFNYLMDVPEDIRSCPEIQQEFSLAVFCDKLLQFVQQWENDYHELQLKELLERVLVPMAGRLLPISSSMAMANGDPSTANAVAVMTRPATLTLFGQELQKESAVMEAYVQHELRSGLVAKLKELQLACTARKAAERLEETDLATYKKGGNASKLGRHLQQEDVTETLLPEYLLSPIYYPGASAIDETIVSLGRHLDDTTVPGLLMAYLTAVHRSQNSHTKNTAGRYLLSPIYYPGASAIDEAIVSLGRHLDDALKPSIMTFLEEYLETHARSVPEVVLLTLEPIIIAAISNLRKDLQCCSSAVQPPGSEGASSGEIMRQAVNWAMHAAEAPHNLKCVYSTGRNEQRRKKLHACASMYAERLGTALETLLFGGPQQGTAQGPGQQQAADGPLVKIVKQRLQDKLSQAFRDGVARLQTLTGMFDERGHVDMARLVEDPLYPVAQRHGRKCAELLLQLQRTDLLCGANIPDVVLELADRLLQPGRPQGMAVDVPSAAEPDRDTLLDLDLSSALLSPAPSSIENTCYICSCIDGEANCFWNLGDRLGDALAREFSSSVYGAAAGGGTGPSTSAAGASSAAAAPSPAARAHENAKLCDPCYRGINRLKANSKLTCPELKALRDKRRKTLTREAAKKQKRAPPSAPGQAEPAQPAKRPRAS